LRGELARQQSTCERQTHNDGYISARGFFKKLVDRLLSKNVKNNLERRQVFLLDTDERFFHRFHAGAKFLDLSFLLQSAEEFENLAAPHLLRRDAVQLGQIKALYS